MKMRCAWVHPRVLREPAAACTGAESGHGLPLVGDRPRGVRAVEHRWDGGSRGIRCWHGPCYTPYRQPAGGES